MKFVCKLVSCVSSFLILSTVTLTNASEVTREGSFDAASPCGYHNTNEDWIYALLSCDYEFEFDRDNGDLEIEEMECKLGFCTEDGPDSDSDDDCYVLDDFEPKFGGVGRSQVNGGDIIFKVFFNFEISATLSKMSNRKVVATAQMEFEEDLDDGFVTSKFNVDFECTVDADNEPSPTASPSISLSPTISSQPSPTPTTCVDLKDWEDRYGDDCDWYKDNDDINCPKTGHKWAPKRGNFIGIVANDACCYCKGY